MANEKLTLIEVHMTDGYVFISPFSQDHKFGTESFSAAVLIRLPVYEDGKIKKYVMAPGTSIRYLVLTKQEVEVGPDGNIL